MQYFINDGCGLNNCYSIKCNKQQEKYCTSTKTGGDRIGPDWITDRITDRITEKKRFKEKKIQKNQIVYELVINK